MRRSPWLTLAVALCLAPRAGFAQEPYGKYMVPPTPITGEPAWRLKSDPHGDAMKMQAARLYVRALDEAEQARADVAAAQQNGARANRRLEIAKRRLQVARETFRRATVLDGSRADYWSHLGYLCLLTEDRSCAVNSFQKSLSIDPNHFTTHQYQGEAYLKDGRIDDAKAELAWLKTKGNMTTLETRTLGAAIDSWAEANPPAK